MAEGETLFGAKAQGLRELEEGGYAVPPFHCIPLARIPHDGAPVLSDLAGLDGFLCRFADTELFSVRSSSVGEDGESDSYAGQYASYLRVSQAGLPEAIRRCAEGMRTGAVAYAEAKGIALPAGGGVIVQRMVEAALSGVAFSANPQGLLNEAVIVCGGSTGDAVVEEKVPVTSYYCNLSDGLRYFEQDEGAPLLSPDHLDELLGALEALGNETPVDVEFCIDEGTLWFLQKRPITTLSTENPLVLDNSNIVESYPGLSLPLTATFAGFAYYQVFKGLARRCMPDDATLAHYDNKLRSMVGCVNGRMYYQISNWYTILKFLPFQSRVIPVWQRMLGVQNTAYDEATNVLSLTQRLRTYRNIAASLWGIPRKMDALQEKFDQAKTLFNEGFRPGARADELADLYDEIARLVLADWDITLLNDLYAFLFTHLLEKQFEQLDGEQGRTRANRYLSHGHELESMKPVRAAFALAEELAADPSLAARLRRIENDEMARSFLATADPFAQRLSGYLDKYGDRCLEELKLETKTMRSNPTLLIDMVLGYARDLEQGTASQTFLENRTGGLAGDAPVGETFGGQAVEKNLDGSVPDLGSGDGESAYADRSLDDAGLVRRALIRFVGKKASLGIANREASRFNRTRLFGMVRMIVMEMAADLVRQGILEDARDVFYLELDELFACARNAADADTCRRTIAARKDDYEGFALLPAYSRLVFAGQVFEKHPRRSAKREASAHRSHFQGTPCSAGSVEAPVLVVSGPVPVEEVRGKILVAKTTDPGWVYMLAVAEGVVSEQGSLLSHTAIISRELGLPAVVGIRGITDTLQTGDVIRLDGDKGSIDVL